MNMKEFGHRVVVPSVNCVSDTDIIQRIGQSLHSSYWIISCEQFEAMLGNSLDGHISRCQGSETRLHAEYFQLVCQ